MSVSLNIAACDQMFATREVAAIYQAWPDKMRENILTLRNLIFEVADASKGVGDIVETLKWNVPAYLTVNPKSGTTIRLSGTPETGNYGLYVHCQTSLIENCRELYPDIFRYETNRALIFHSTESVPEKELRHFVALALTYHLPFGPTPI